MSQFISVPKTHEPKGRDLSHMYVSVLRELSFCLGYIPCVNQFHPGFVCACGTSIRGEPMSNGGVVGEVCEGSRWGKRIRKICIQ